MIKIQDLVRFAPKGFDVLKVERFGDGAEMLLADKDGRHFRLALTAEPELERGEPDRPIDPAPTPAAEPMKPSTARIYEERRLAARAGGTRAAPKTDFAATFQIIRMSGDTLLSAEAKELIGELEKSPLREGDDTILLAATRAARGGDVGPLRDLAEKRRRPSAHAASPPA